MRNLTNKTKKQAGFSLVEAMVSTFIFLSLLGAVYSSIGSSWSYVNVQSTYAKVQMDGRKALDRISSELRMSSWMETPMPGQPQYPYVFVNGMADGFFAAENHAPAVQHVGPGRPAFGDVKEIIFKIPVDLDGDGLPTDGVTGEVEWSDYDISYVLLTDASGVNTLVRRESGVVTDIIARYVERITFDTIKTDPAVAANEIGVTVYMARPTPDGKWVEMNLSTCVTMRNVPDAS